ncbi:MAG: hypothetical protein FD126_2419 [Elusimicrobia bacterium]|nr:MAG: hypothetical protein FD126_2419 [Elusimicrobiota bacterium]
MDQVKFVAEHLKRQTLRKLSRRIETGAVRAFPSFIGGRWSTQVVRLRRRNLQLTVPTAARAVVSSLPGIFALAAFLLAAPASALINHWEIRTVSLTGPEAVLLYKNLNTPEVVSNGGFRQPSRMKAAFFGPFMTVCDTHAAPVCWIGWPEPDRDRVEASVAEMGGVPPCLALVEAEGAGASFRCSPEGITVTRKPKAAK